MGDINLDSNNGKWLDSKYYLVSLARMVQNCCISNNFHQMVTDITRVQFDSIKKKIRVSCIDHLYTNAKHRISTVKVIGWGSSDHNAICYTRFSKEPKPSARTIRKRSYKYFDADKYLEDMSKVEFSDVYSFVDVDTAAYLDYT